MFDKVEAFYRPSSAREALKLLLKGRGEAHIVAGATDLAVHPARPVRFLIDLTHAGLNYVRVKGRSVQIGAATTMTDLEESPEIRGLACGILARAAATCGSIQIRNVATIGGNLVNGSPAADLAVTLLALDATVILATSGGRQKIAIADYVGRQFADSLLTEIVVPALPARRSGWSFQKLGRTAVDISLVSVAAGLHLDGKRRVVSARIALGAVAPAPMRALQAESLLVGKTPDGALIAEAAALVERAVQPISDVRASADYRREMSAVLARRALEECAVLAGYKS